MLTAYFGAAEELKRVISEDYAERYRGKEFYPLAKDLSKAIVQLGQAATSMQFLDRFRSSFLRFMELMNNLETIAETDLKEKARLALNFVIELILKWQEEGLLGSFS